MTIRGIEKSFAAVVLAMGLLAAARSAQADVFNFTSCHLSGGCDGETTFGTVTLTQDGTSVNFDVFLSDGNRFVETGAGGGEVFLFNDSLAGSTIINPQTGMPANAVPGGLSGFTNLSPVMADGTGTFTASVECTTSSDCNGGSTPTFQEITFTVTNATLAQLETTNANGNFFVADILLGATGMTGPVDVSTPPVPEPSTLPLLGCFLCAVVIVGRKFRHRANRA